MPMAAKIIRTRREIKKEIAFFIESSKIQCRGRVCPFPLYPKSMKKAIQNSAFFLEIMAEN